MKEKKEETTTNCIVIIIQAVYVLGLILIAIGLTAFAFYLTYDALSGNFSFNKAIFAKTEGKETKKIPTITFHCSDCLKKKQISKFSELVRKLTENPENFKKVGLGLSYGEDQLGTKRIVTAEMLLHWKSYDFIYLGFPEGFYDELPGRFAIRCNNYDRENPEFFARIKTVRKTSYGSSERSIPYFMARTGKESIPEVEKMRYVLESIEYAIYAIDR